MKVAVVLSSSASVWRGRWAAYLVLMGLLCGPSSALPAGEPELFVDVARSLKAQDEAATGAASSIRDGRAEAPQILAWLADPSAAVRDRVVDTLAKSADAALLESLERGFRTKSSVLIEGLAEIHRRRGFDSSAPALLEALTRRKLHPAGQVEVMRALSVVAVGSEKAFKAIEKVHKKSAKRPLLKGEALRALAAIDPAAARALITAALEDRQLAVRGLALDILRGVDEPACVAAVVASLKSYPKLSGKVGGTALLFAALDTLSAIEKPRACEAGLKAAIGAMIDCLEGAEGREQHDLGRCLSRVTGEQNVAPEAFAWKAWWEARRGSWKPAKAFPKPGAEEDAVAAGATRVRYHGIPIHSLRLTFCQDVSGGMRNPVGGRGSDTEAKLVVSKLELAKVVGELDPRARLNLLYFATYFYRCSPSPLIVGKKRKAFIAFNEAQSIPTKSGHGRSNLFDSISFAMGQPGIDTVYLLTEGGPTEGKYVLRRRFIEHLEELYKYRRVRVHTLLMGTSKVGARYLKAIAAATGGRFYDLEKMKK
jgi:hypothetical protein